MRDQSLCGGVSAWSNPESLHTLQPPCQVGSAATAESGAGGGLYRNGALCPYSAVRKWQICSAQLSHSQKRPDVCALQSHTIPACTYPDASGRIRERRNQRACKTVIASRGGQSRQSGHLLRAGQRLCSRCSKGGRGPRAGAGEFCDSLGRNTGPAQGYHTLHRGPAQRAEPCDGASGVCDTASARHE